MKSLKNAPARNANAVKLIASQTNFFKEKGDYMLLMYGIGLCEHCGIVVTMEGRQTDGAWHCKCKGELTCKSFGLTEDGEKIKWVGPDGKWVDEKPIEDFRIKFGDSEISIVERRPSPTIYRF